MPDCQYSDGRHYTGDREPDDGHGQHINTVYTGLMKWPGFKRTHLNQIMLLRAFARSRETGPLDVGRIRPGCIARHKALQSVPLHCITLHSVSVARRRVPLHHAVFCCAVLQYLILHRTILRCITVVLHCIIMHCVASYCALLYFIVLNCIVYYSYYYLYCYYYNSFTLHVKFL